MPSKKYVIMTEQGDVLVKRRTTKPNKHSFKGCILAKKSLCKYY